MWLTTLFLFALLLVLLWAYSAHRQSYWAKRRVPTFPKTLPLIGHLSHMMSKKRQRWEYIDEVYRKHGGSTFCGYYEFLQPILLVGDPELAKLILIKDFDHFVDRRTFTFPLEEDDVGNHFLTNATGAHWKGIRSVLSPSFTSGRLKGMFPLVADKADKLVDYLLKLREEKGASSFALKKTFGLYTLEVIASCAFGMESGTMEDEDSLFNQNVAKFSKIGPLRMLKFILFMAAPKLCQLLRIRFIQDEMIFFMDVVKESMAQRKAGLYRGDFLDLMMEAQVDQENPSSKMPKYPLTEKIIVANSVLFILAGFDTTATTISFVAFLLAKYPEVQQKLRKELNGLIQEPSEMTYQGIMEAKYLDACLSETLRMYSPAHFTERQCTKEYKLPGTDVVIAPKTVVSIPIHSIHHDERYWSDPEEFRPERFMPENAGEIKSGTYIPFGVGPRNCIGMRFAQMESKLIIAKLLLNFELSCVPGSEDLELSRQLGLMRPSDTLEIAFKPLR
ncbi:cytochrome P450 9e2-like [Macrobrachium nipponense]|uniref:cytochrome P450 9e2-like n=1 Tax=Macrobrachium nipponense TaxID=159736 RepID=UPI0030C7E8AE